MKMSQEDLKKLIETVVMEQLGPNSVTGKNITPDGLISVNVPSWNVTEEDKMDTGNPADEVYTKDFFNLSESPRLGAGLMVMKESTFDWKLNYDEVDYVIDGELAVIGKSGTAKAHKGQMILIPKGSQIKFSAPKYARFVYITYPADWENQK
ncbi:ethanolamine utilization protein EutQ [Limosilactobacillus reuteri]|uniref:ethanolamine utilization protein EutQ n=1 Tax=Limosilactobacillus reuteri TaxID=1598 RepID=UPI000C1B75BF|nr:ethanolamine utilization protein EutQ [Limosilactobacillus reuteri]MDW5473931.1 ethanolamine utilization protein EutQ [Limosilactobacillus reuteri]PIN29826.1 ethanolamine utilization protein EutQ [Limosilactobacillus reuteri]PUH33294.1 ethanolamine utilization protein EutQ [Limosilactobacillus reuteri]PUH33730.1 ethanolamine utilization protein EutQ [Limosilactobacillus reuteri]WLC95612.1 ethanolamine utilization protein EutQ [Limosilactobacillus reuteri]